MKPLKLLLASVVTLAVLQVMLWALIGRNSLPSSVPAIVERHSSQALEQYQAKDIDPGSTRPVTVRICHELVDAVGHKGVERISRALEPFNAKVVSDQGSLSPEPKRVQDLCCSVGINTPLFAKLEYGQAGQWGSESRLWFILGVWLPGKTTSSWVS